jgi:hypothetical protein
MIESPEKVIINVQYNVPRYIIAKPGKQNRACTGEMRITPGIAEPFEFVYMNTDGLPINLAGFKLLLTFFFPQAQYETLAANMQNNIVLAKYLQVDQPYEGTAVTVLSDQETLQLAQGGRSTLRWTVYLISDDGNTYASQITAAGGRYGICHIDDSEIPSADTIQGITISQ